MCVALCTVNSTIHAKYVHNSDHGLMQQGMWRDPETNLVWMRCSLGQTWNGKTCTGEAEEYIWRNTFDAVEEFNSRGGFGGYTDWVVPHIEDLSTIRYCSTGFEQPMEIPTKAGGTKTVDDRCKGDNYQQPTINQRIFPKTDCCVYWSSSRITDNGDVWLVHFNLGRATHERSTVGWGFKYGSIRLVRSTQ